MTKLAKALSLVLFIVMAVQLADTDCFAGELTFKSIGVQSEHSADAPDHGKEHCPCPCHDTFLQFNPPVLVTHSGIHSPLASTVEFHLKQNSTDIFQPPKALI